MHNINEDTFTQAVLSAMEVVDFIRHAEGAAPDGTRMHPRSHTLDHDFILHHAEAGR